MMASTSNIGLNELRVGVAGADTKASWAKASHVPAITALPGLRLAAVATRSEGSAREAAEAFGADRWFADASEMVRSDEIDIVSVCVKVPAHRALVLAALAEGLTAHEVAGLSILATLMALATLEHGFLMLPLPSAALWQWSLPKIAPSRPLPSPIPAARSDEGR